MIKNRFFKNTFWILFGQIIRMMISFIVGILTARYLGPSNNGIITYVNSYIAFFTSIIGLGLNGVIIHEFVNNRHEEGKILGTAIFLRFILGIISAFAFVGIVFLTDGRDKTVLAVAILQAIQLPFLCFDTVNYWYQSNMNSKYSVLVQTIAYIVTSVYKVYLLISGKSVVWFGFAVSLDVIVLAVLFFLLYQKQKNQNLSYSLRIAKRILKGCTPFVLANIMVVIYGHMDKIMIKHLLGNTRDVGLYSAALAICSIIGFIPGAILDSSRPLIAEAKNESEEKYQLRFRQLVAGIMWVCILYSLFITLFSKIIIYFMYGMEYMDSNVCLKICVWYTSFSYLGSARNFWLICEDKKRFVFVFSAIGAVCNVVMNFVFIPLWGINGAAIATLVTQVFANFILPMFFKQTKDYGKAVIQAVMLKKFDLKNNIKFVIKKFK